MPENDPYEFTLLPEIRLIKATLRGFWTVETVQDYAGERGTAIDALIALGCPANGVRILVDQRGQPPQDKMVVEALREALASSHQSSVRTAILVSGALLRRQAHRIGVVGDVAVFVAESDAWTWLNGS